ncbi:hypothetical protein E4U58_000373 [Claviceps cyperi]|nr:hypothetical protein E4U58_000373 [Claviceps cyperi]
MRHHTQVAAVACLFLCSQTVEAGPLNWEAAAAADVYVARREDHPLSDDAPAMMVPNSIPRVLLPTLPSTDLSSAVSTTAAGTVKTVKTESADAYSDPLSLVIAPLPTPTPTSAPRLDTARDGHAEAATATLPATSIKGELSSAVSASSTQPLIVGILPTESTSSAGFTELPQGTDGAVVSTPSGGGLTDGGANPSLSTSVSGNGTLPTAVVSSTTSDDVPSTSTTPDNVLSTTSDNGSPTTSAEAIHPPTNSNTQLLTSPDLLSPHIVSGSATEPAVTHRIPSPIAGNTSTTLLSTAHQNAAPIALPTDGLLATTTCETAQITSSLPPTQAAPTIPVPQESGALTPPILDSAAPTSTSSSTSTPTSAQFPYATSFEPTSTTNAGVPTATSSVEPVIYSHNLAQAKNLNKIYSNLTDHSPCSGTQTACIGSKTGKCIDGAFVFTDCPAAQRCYALPRTDTRGTRNACLDPAEASRILEPDTTGAEEGTTSTGSSTLRTETKGTILTHTRVVVITDMPSGPWTEVPIELTAQPERHGNTFIAVTSLVPSETSGMAEITLVSSSPSAYSSPVSSSVSSVSSVSSSVSSVSSSVSSSQSSSPSPTPTPSLPEPEPESSETEPSSEPFIPAVPSPSPSSSLSSSPPPPPPPLASSLSLTSPPPPFMPSSPTPPPTTTPLPDPITTNQPSFIVVIQTLGTPTQSSQTTTSTTTSSTPGRLVLIPVELSSLPSLPTTAGITTTPPVPTASLIGSIHLASSHAGAVPAGPESSNPHTTVTSNATPTVSVHLTVTVTQKEKETITMKEKETVTVTVTVTAMPT